MLHDVHSMETAVKTGNASCLLAGRRGRSEAQAPTEKGGGAISSVDRFRLLFRSVGRRSQTFWKCGKVSLVA